MAADRQTDPGKGESQGAAAEPQSGRFSIERIYVKDISFETPNSPTVFGMQWEPKVDLQVFNDAARLDEALYEVVLRITATVTVHDKTAFLAEVNQAGLFGISGIEDEAGLKAVLGGHCPGILFPYARETISDLVTRGGFPQFLLAPVNFDAVYARHLAEQQKEDGAAATPSGD
ncbi:MAG: protein-export chaperone SecB [Gammaproteobacteria bacterium]|nr:protein-export chaperone SecB [Gammaproteobacteria bacterium]NIR81825.1 protein-export chaperone SecB [Gammaproteobacteria bacterium]NIR88657.1 protein-export chaperone SecB [Gammaproteobacteria bacterium]NIU02933.1 protein-export chaperone SecB [Gammaproteobacteria bacterium]NIV50454.1 protein-export chaperone SecB [Gammaproteobacteria bacterium]